MTWNNPIHSGQWPSEMTSYSGDDGVWSAVRGLFRQRTDRLSVGWLPIERITVIAMRAIIVRADGRLIHAGHEGRSTRGTDRRKWLKEARVAARPAPPAGRDWAMKPPSCRSTRGVERNPRRPARGCSGGGAAAKVLKAKKQGEDEDILNLELRTSNVE